MYSLDTSSPEKGIRPRREKPEFPPPLLPRAALKRYHTCDGRLVIQWGRLPVYFQAHRENNRLTIDLVSFYNVEEKKREDIDNDFVTDNCDGVSDNMTVEEEEDEPVTIRCGYGLRSNSCMVGIKVPEIRHIEISL